jgi:hypothetical protein
MPPTLQRTGCFFFPRTPHAALSHLCCDRRPRHCRVRLRAASLPSLPSRSHARSRPSLSKPSVQSPEHRRVPRLKIAMGISAAALPPPPAAAARPVADRRSPAQHFPAPPVVRCRPTNVLHPLHPTLRRRSVRVLSRRDQFSFYHMFLLSW